MKRAALVMLPVVAVLAGCGGGGALHAVPAAPGSAPSRGSANVAIKILIPAPPSTMSAARRAQFVSASTNGVLVKVYQGSSPTPLVSATDISSGSVACGGTVGLPRTCTVPLPAPVGSDTFDFTTYDQPPVSGAFTGAKQLGAGSVVQTIVADQANAVSVTLGGVVSGVSLALTNPVIRGTLASSQVLTVVALDADGNAIISDGYVDASGNPVTIALSQAIANAGGGGGTGTTSATGVYGGTVTLGATSLAQPSTTGVPLAYDGAAQLPSCTASPCDGTFVDTFTATPSNGATPGSTTLTTLGPKLIEYPVPTGNAYPYDIAPGPDGNLWFTEWGGNKIGKITTSGAIIEYPVPASGAYPHGITAGPDGNLWFTEQDRDNIGKITTGGAIIEYPVPTTGAYPYGIAAGPDGNLWFTEYAGNNIGKITTGGTVTEYPIPTSNAEPFDIAPGPDGNLWFTEQSGNQIGRIATGGTITEYAVPTGDAAPSGIAAGPDGNLWFTEEVGNNIGKITTSGTITEYAVPTGDASLHGITAGPDGNLWFTEQSGNNIGKITTSGAITEYAIPTGFASPVGIAAGPDGNLWFTEEAGNNIGEFIW